MNRFIFPLIFLLINSVAFAQSSAFIYGGGDLCDNAGTIDMEISLTGTPPWNIVYAIDGMSQPSIATSSNPYIIPTKMAGVYTVVSVSDAVVVGTTSGSAIVSVLQAPTAQFTVVPDTLSSLYPTTHFVDASIGNIVNWWWNFGDNSFGSLSANPYHTYADSVGLYQITMIVKDENSCKDTTFNQLWVKDEYWIYYH